MLANQVSLREVIALCEVEWDCSFGVGPIGAELGDGLGGMCPKIFSQIFE